MLTYLMPGRARRKLFGLLWGGATGSVSALSRGARLSFSTTHRELEAMRSTDLAFAERVGAEVVYRANFSHPQAGLLRQLAALPQVSPRQKDQDSEVMGWLANVGAPLESREGTTPTPPLEVVLAEALSVAHRNPTVARVLPTTLWRCRKRLDLNRLADEATRRDEKQSLGYFLELAGQLGGEHGLVVRARRLRDKRRTKPRLFFAGRHGRYELAATMDNTPKEASRWRFLMNMNLDSFRSTFEKFAAD